MGKMAHFGFAKNRLKSIKTTGKMHFSHCAEGQKLRMCKNVLKLVKNVNFFSKKFRQTFQILLSRFWGLMHRYLLNDTFFKLFDSIIKKISPVKDSECAKIA